MNILNPKEIYNALHNTNARKKDRKYMYRGVGRKEEIIEILRGGESGRFWSNYPDISYFSVGLLIAKNEYPNYRFLGELPIVAKLKLKDIKAIYIQPYFFGIPWFEPVRVYPKMSFKEFKSYYPKANEKIYNIIYNSVDNLIYKYV